MNKTYKWKIPKSFYRGKHSETLFFSWISDFSEDLCSIFAKGLREKLGFSYDDYDTSRDDFDIVIKFDETEAFFAVNFRYMTEESEALIFDVFVSALKFKKFFFFDRRIEPEKEVFDRFDSCILELARDHQIEVFEEK